MNPPLRTADDRQALLEAVQDGTIDMIATDHAPHTAEEKSKGLAGSLMGIVGLETAFSLLYTHLVKTNLISLEQLIHLLHHNPAARFGIGNDLTVGNPADFTVFDLDAQNTIDPEQFLSKGRSTPFAGEKVWGRCLMTFVKGELVWQEH